MMIKCPECGRELSDKAESCPDCGFPISSNIQQNNEEQRNEAYERYLAKEREQQNSLKNGIKYGILCFVGFIVLGSCFMGGNKNDEYDRNSNVTQEASTPTPTPTPTQTPTPTPETTEKQKKDTTKKIPKKQYKKKCKHVYYDDILLSNNDITGKYFKLDLFFEERVRFDMYDSSAHDFTEKYKVEPTFWHCAVLRKGTNSYVGNYINVYSYEDDEKIWDVLYSADKITVYGQVIKSEKDSWTGYNNVHFVVKYIE